MSSAKAKPGTHWPVRIRLTLGFLAAFSGVLIVLEVLDDTAMSTFQDRVAREDLEFKVGQVRDAIRSERAAHDPPSELSFDGTYLEIVGPDGRVLSRSDNLEEFYLPARTRGHLVPEGAATIDAPVLMASTSLAIPGRKGYLAFVGLPQDAIDEARHYKRISGLIALAAGLLLTGLVGFYLAGRALRPVERLRAEVEGIGAEDLDRRLDASRLPRDEIGRLAETFNDLLDRVADSRVKQQRFVQDASHDLRSPVTAILGYAQLLRKRHREDPSLIEETADAIAKEGDRLRRLVNDLLLLAQPQGTRTDQLVDLAAIAAEMVAVRQQIEPAVRLGRADAAPVRADGDHVRRIIGNLLDNAAKAIVPGGVVEVAVHVAGPRACLCVRDDGAGIPEAEQELVFERFYRLESARNGEGSGLGLSIVKALARSYGGQAYLESRPGQGTTVTVEFPLES